MPLAWAVSLRYLGSYIVAGRQFRCSVDNMKKSFNRSFNAIFGKVGRAASHDVIMQLIVSKCLPCLLYNIEICPWTKRIRNSIEFTFNRVLMKVFQTTSVTVIQDCLSSFGIETIQSTVLKRKVKFLNRFLSTDNILCQYFTKTVDREMKIFIHRKAVAKKQIKRKYKQKIEQSINITAVSPKYQNNCNTTLSIKN